ncbi:hypothetical protein B9Z55_003044 [Caenorhabditis nigoni]|uniref:Uncharacterized protein n=1 Tax=Caenorhabditis nigoni TaxID=1611254 RepID=A0A2G5VNV7_9PELO|nr:hypothetical protein B9Z55_003044 [Caenorhabditis nigoni]
MIQLALKCFYLSTVILQHDFEKSENNKTRLKIKPQMTQIKIKASRQSEKDTEPTQPLIEELADEESLIKRVGAVVLSDRSKQSESVKNEKLWSRT